MRKQRDELAAAFAPAAADALAVLSSDAGTLPETFSPAQADALDVSRFAAWDRCRDALAQLDQIGRAVAPLYPSHTDYLSLRAVASLRIVDLPLFTDYQHAGTFALALAGIRHGGSSLGPTAHVDVLTPAAVAALGGTFAWGTPSDVERRIAAITSAAVEPVLEQPSRPTRTVVRS